MRRIMVRYKVKPDRAAENEELVRAVYEELQRTQPAGLHYATVALEDGVSFVHLSSIDTEDGRNPLSDVEAFARFQEGIGDRCVKLDVFTPRQACRAGGPAIDPGGSHGIEETAVTGLVAPPDSVPPAWPRRSTSASSRSTRKGG